MKMIKKLLPLLLCMMMVVTAFAVAASAADGAANVSMTVSATEVNVGDTVTVTVSCGDMTVSSFACKLMFDNSVLECTKIVGARTADKYAGNGYLYDSYEENWVKVTSMANTTEANNVSQVGFVHAGTEDADYSANTVFTATFTAKAAGNVTFTLVEDSEGADGYKATAETKTLTIMEAHTCTLAPVTGQAATCTVDGWKDYYQCSDENCGKLYADADGETEITLDAWKNGAGKIVAGHAYGELVPATGAVHTKDTLTAGVAAHYICDVCNTYFTVDKEETTLAALTGEKPAHTPGTAATCTTAQTCTECDYVYEAAKGHGKTLGFRYDNIIATTHDVCCKDCGEAVETGVAHDYTYDAAGHKCVCGAKFTGWDGDCYYEEALLQKTGWTEIDDAWYYLDTETGVRAEGLTRVPYPTETINGITYVPNQEDIDYFAAKGKEFMDATEAWFIFDENGKFQSDVNGKYEGPKATCYAVNGMIPWHYGLAKITNKYYYFVGDAVNGGNKVADGPVWVTRTNGVEGLEAGACYYFLGGVMANNLTDIVDGKYFENGKYMIGAGLVQVGEDYYYVRSSGAFATGKYYITKTNGIEGFETGMKLYFDETGKMLPIKNGVVEEGGELYFYQNNHMMCGAGLIEYKGAIYYVRSSGKVAIGTYYITNTNGMEGFKANDKLLFGEDGKLIVTEKKDGIVEEGGALYYYENGRIAYNAGLLEIENGVYIYVRSNGQLAIGEYYVTNVNGMEGFEVNEKLIFGSDGKLTAN